jgi:hypothetical protein
MLLRIGVLNHSGAFISCSYTISNASGADAELSPEWAIQGGQQENHQTQNAREYYCHPEVHALAPHVEEPGQRDTEEGSGVSIADGQKPTLSQAESDCLSGIAG